MSQPLSNATNNDRIFYRFFVYLLSFMRSPKHILVSIAVILMITLEKFFVLSNNFWLENTANALSTSNFSLAYYWFIVYVLAAFANAAVSNIRSFVFTPIMQKYHEFFLGFVLEKLYGLSHDYHSNKSTGKLSNVLSRVRSAAEVIIYYILFTFIPLILEISIISFIFLYRFGWASGLFLFASIIAYVVWTYKVTLYRIPIRTSMNDLSDDAQAKALDGLMNYETVKYFNNESLEIKQYRGILHQLSLVSVRWDKSTALLNFGQSFIILSAIAFVGYNILGLVQSGEQQIGVFMFVIFSMGNIYGKLGSLGMMMREVRESITNLSDCYAILDEPEHIKDPLNPVPFKDNSIGVEFNNVSFSYNNERHILKSVNFTLEQGKTTALVGFSGSGKTTCLKLLFRFYDPTSGAVYFNGTNIKDLSLSSVRGNIGIVAQDTALFNASLAYNIRYGNLNATDEDLEKAVQMAGLSDFIKLLDKGLYTEVGERGIRLSGGERQRVSIARVLLRKPKLLVFDEATSALDSRTENFIQDSIKSIAKDTTTLIIAHRLSTIMEADKIIVMDQGQVMEQGTHTELLANKNSYYYHLWKEQLKEMHTQPIDFTD